MKDLEEGGKCPICLVGTLKYPDPEGCTCHINPPCSACVDRELECSDCGLTESEIMLGNKYE